jgi:hypothetical protein
MVLLCDYGLRSDQNPMVFVLVAFLYRVIRLLGLDSPPPLENPGDPAQVLERDVQNRLVWACYFIDLFMATGVEKNACWKGSAPDILLPAPDEFFSVQSPAIQYALPDMDGMLDANIITELDLPAVSIIAILLRIQGLR